jgi:hypothetical protein
MIKTQRQQREKRGDDAVSVFWQLTGTQNVI